MAELIGKTSSTHSKAVAFVNSEAQELCRNGTEHRNTFVAPKVVTIAEAAAGRQDRLTAAQHRAGG